MQTAWSHLLNASRIDQIIVHVKANPKEWAAARYAARDAGRSAARDAARDAAYDAARDAGRSAARDAGRSAARDAAYVAARDAAYVAACDAALALVAWDHAGSLLDLPSDQVLMLSKLEQPAAILMYPAVLAMSDNG